MPHRMFLPANLQVVYDLILRATFNYRRKVTVPSGDIQSINFVVNCVINDNPLIFHMSKWVVNAYRNQAIVHFSYDMSHSQYLAFRNRCMSIALDYCKNLSEDFDKELHIHDVIVQNVTYKTTGNKYDHTILGPLIYRNAVCDGISKTVKLLADIMGLQSAVVTGTAVGLGTGPHAWNKVQIYGQWFHLDVTFDLTISGNILRRDYFNLSDAEISIDHNLNDGSIIRELPCSFGDADYYSLASAVVHNVQELQNYCTNMMNRTNTFVVKIHPTWIISSDEVKEIIMLHISRSRNLTLSSNDNLRVYTIHCSQRVLNIL